MAEVPDSDWRLNGEFDYLKNVTLFLQSYRPYPKNPARDHDHCEFCWAKFTADDNPENQHEGYTTADEYRWICRQCFQDLGDRFNWQVGSRDA